MPSRESYENNAGEAQVGAQSLLNMIGQSKHVTAGWPGFALKSLVVSFSASTVFGLASWMLFQGPLGPGLSFMVGASFGSVGGLVSRWRTDVGDALHLANKFPHLIELHVRRGEARYELGSRTFSEWAEDLARNPRKQGHVVAAMYSATPALQRIHDDAEDAIIAAYAAREAAVAAADMDEAFEQRRA